MSIEDVTDARQRGRQARLTPDQAFRAPRP